jgi:methyltransferase (TIGR00027 family)
MWNGYSCISFRIDTTIRVFEIDTQVILEAKQNVLCDETPKCHRIPVAANLEKDDCVQLIFSNSFDSTFATLWIMEGVLQYFTNDQVKEILTKTDTLSARGSHLFTDIYNPVHNL